MAKFIQELKERGVIRVAGLYGAAVWLLLQASDVLFPAFGIPDSAVRILLGAAIACLPFVLAFAWFYELTDKGIQREEAVRTGDATRLLSGNDLYYVIIGMLALALSISVYMNFSTPPGVEASDAPHAPVSVLIADFDNRTRDPIFDGSVEQALGIGVEGAAFVTAYSRSQAIKIADGLRPGEGLGEERARLVALREGISLVLAGSIEADGEGYDLTLRSMQPRDGGVVGEVLASAATKSEVLQAVGALAAGMREMLGDATSRDEATAETFSTTSLDAVSAYINAQKLAHEGKHEQAVTFYGEAVAQDPQFGRAYSGWALSESKLGREDAAAELWKQTLARLDSMTEREKYRTLGVYYGSVTRNYDKTIETYERLVDQYPADLAGLNNLAVGYFLTRRFADALEAGRKALDIYPREPLLRSNYSLYAMYAGDFATARAQAQKILEDDQSFYKYYLPLAMASLEQGDPDSARQAYADMAAVDGQGASVAAAGLADVAMYEGDFEAALAALRLAIDTDLAAQQTRFLAAKYVAHAQALVALKRHPEAREAIDDALGVTRGTAQLVAAAQMYVQMGDLAAAEAVADELAANLQRENRAYADLIRGLVALARERYSEAVDSFNAAIARSDMWLSRLNLGKAYALSGFHAEALSEFETCERRRGEATALFLDDIPTFHVSVELQYWLGRAQGELGMSAASGDTLRRFLAHRMPDDRSSIVADAKARLDALATPQSSTKRAG